MKLLFDEAWARKSAMMEDPPSCPHGLMIGCKICVGDAPREEVRAMKVGDPVVWVDAVGEQLPALVTAIWGTGETPCINVVFVSRDNTRTDTYGRQIERQTSVVHRSQQQAHGWYWMHEGDTPNPVLPGRV